MPALLLRIKELKANPWKELKRGNVNKSGCEGNTSKESTYNEFRKLVIMKK